MHTHTHIYVTPLAQADADVAGDVFLFFFFFFFILAGLVVLSYRQAHFYAAPRARVPVCRDDVGHDVAERVHRVPQLARRVRVSCCHDRDLHLRLVRTGLCPRRRRCGRNDLLLLG